MGWFLFLPTTHVTAAVSERCQCYTPRHTLDQDPPPLCAAHRPAALALLGSGKTYRTASLPLSPHHSQNLILTRPLGDSCAHLCVGSANLHLPPTPPLPPPITAALHCCCLELHNHRVLGKGSFLENTQLKDAQGWLCPSQDGPWH